MPHDTSLIATIVVGLGIAFFMGAIAQRLRISPIAGYLLAGIIVGPYTPGFVADAGLALQLAEIGVILLMFGVGLHFSLKDLLSVRAIALPGAVVQISVATLLGVGLGLSLGWTLAGSVIFGLALSVASTVVLLRALQARDMLDTEKGRIAVGWLIVEDLAMVLALVLLPAIFEVREQSVALLDLLRSAGGVLLKVAVFMALMFVIGRRVLPRILHWTAHTGSRELFRLAVLSIALGVAFGAAVIFDVSFALGAFFAGMILGETPLSRRAAEETLPLRDAFAVLFFVSVGMLFDPSVVVEHPLPLLGVVAIIVVGKSLAAYGIVRAFGYGRQTALTISVSLAQIGEFSFIVAGLGVGLGVMNEMARDLILAGSLLSILLNPILFTLAVRQIRGDDDADRASLGEEVPQAPPQVRTILVGYGRVGRQVAELVRARGDVLTVIEDQADMAEAARAAGFAVILGDAAKEKILRAAGVDEARSLLIAIREGVEAGAIVRRAREMAPNILIVARAHHAEESADMRARGADLVVLAELEVAGRMAQRAGLAR